MSHNVFSGKTRAAINRDLAAAPGSFLGIGQCRVI
jgi:hypothetical protein